MKKRICIIVDDYLPKSIKVAGKMMHELALEFQKNGHTVTVITPDNTLKAPYILDKYQSIDVLRFQSGKIKNVWKPLRLVNEFMLSYRARKSLKTWIKTNPQDLIVFYSPTIFFGGLVSFLKSVWNCKSFLIVRDFFPQWTIDNGILQEGSLLVKFFRFYERKMYSVADRIGIQSPANIRWFEEKYPEFSNTILLYNWASEKPNSITHQDTNGLSKSELVHSEVESKKSREQISFRQKHNLEGRVIFFYGGNIGKAQNMKNLVDLADSMKSDNDAIFVFLGAGDEVSYVHGQIQTRKLTNSILLPSVSQGEYLSILDEIDVGLIALHPSHKTHNFPGKILGYMQKSLPILGVVNPGNDLQSLIHTAGAGYIHIGSDLTKLTVHAKKMLSHSTRTIQGKASRQLLLNEFSVSKAVSIILKSTIDLE